MDALVRYYIALQTARYIGVYSMIIVRLGAGKELTTIVYLLLRRNQSLVVKMSLLNFFKHKCRPLDILIFFDRIVKNFDSKNTKQSHKQN